MIRALRPREIRITLGSPAEIRRGLMAYVLARFDAFDVDGITVRRTLRKRLVLSYPSRESRSGEQFPHFLPTDPGWREEFEEELLMAYHREVNRR
jgi:hypothetical protein